LLLDKNDLAWVTINWQSEGCDLWEEVRPNDFFWGRSSFVFSLNDAADFCDAVGDSCAADYRKVFGDIDDGTNSNWTGEYIGESSNRMIDGAVIHAIASFGKYLFKPSVSKAAATLDVYAKAFREGYPIIQSGNEAWVAGILIGRYRGDACAGGNPFLYLFKNFIENLS
jgi:hypothetical protein